MAIEVLNMSMDHMTAGFEKDNGILVHADPIGPPTPPSELSSESSVQGLWSPDTWRAKPIQQSVAYPNAADLEWTCGLLSRLPALVSASAIESARKEFFDVALGRAFIIQGGDCAESFSDVLPESVRGHMSLLANQATILSAAMGGKPVIEIGRIAGQYAKPRSNPIETLPTGEKVPSFRGENVNSANPKERTPDPSRLVLGYVHASKRLQLINQFRGGGDYAGKPGKPFHTSHEALHLPLESALTHGLYNTSATFLWIGARTADVDGAHVEYMRGIRNPIGIKIGPTMSAATVVELLDTICPDRQASWGRVTLITRLGTGKVAKVLPSVIRAVQLSGHMPVWLCDPCHGNTEATAEGFKTRRLERMLEELTETYKVHHQMGNYLGGIHLEQSGELVTECMDSTRVTESGQLAERYETLCDPRLAKDQAISLVQKFAEFVKTYPN